MFEESLEATSDRRTHIECFTESALSAPDDPDEEHARPDLHLIIDALQEPAFLVTGRGNVIYVNDRAREAFPETPPWLRSVVKAPHSRHFERLCFVHEVELGDQLLFLVIPFAQGSAGRCQSDSPRLLEGLSPALAQIAELLLLGLSDREIEECTDLSLASVRTYTRRLYQRLGVSGRQELFAIALVENKRRREG